MLGEDHSLLFEFPEHADKIRKLKESNNKFSIDLDRYNTVDSEIRKLELGNAPIGDSEMHVLKRERSVLKDSLYKMIVAD